jgi:hypothetical protein
MKSDLHDVEFELFGAIEEEYPAIAKQVGIPKFREKVASLSRLAGKHGDTTLRMSQQLSPLHEEASEILRRLVQSHGPQFVRRLFH